MNSNIGENIKELRYAGNMTQSELAERVGMTKATISAYENCTRLPSYDVLIKIAALFHVSTDNLLGFSNKYTIDVSGLTAEQRNVVQEIIFLYEHYNGYTPHLPNEMLQEIENERRRELERLDD